MPIRAKEAKALAIKLLPEFRADVDLINMAATLIMRDVEADESAQRDEAYAAAVQVRSEFVPLADYAKAKGRA